MIKKITSLAICFVFFYSFNLKAQPYSYDSDSLGLNTLYRSVYCSAIQADGKILLGGNFWKYKKESVGKIIRLRVDGTMDTTFKPGIGANAAINSISIQSDGKIIIGGDFTSWIGISRYHVARLNTDGTLDYSFNVGAGADGNVKTTTLQSDGKIIIGGYFSQFDGNNSNKIARLNSNGSFDNSYAIGSGLNGEIFSAAMQPNGKIIIGGNFTIYNGSTRNRIARINSDGTLDNTFDPLTGPNSNPMTISIQSDTKIVIGGLFSNYNGNSRWGVARINADGSLDNSFNPGTGTNGSVLSSVIQTDGKIIVGGWFTTYNGIPANYLARINSDGTRDFGFVPSTDDVVYTLALLSTNDVVVGGDFKNCNNEPKKYFARLTTNGILDHLFNIDGGSNGIVNSMAIQSDGKILVGGEFGFLNGEPLPKLARLLEKGKIDPSFSMGTGISGTVNIIKLQKDGKIIVGGSIYSYNSTVVNNLVRLNADGTLDPSFNTGTGANGPIFSVSIQDDGKIIIGGPFTTFNGVSKNYITRLNSNGSLDAGFLIGTGTNAPVLCSSVQADGKILLGGYFSSYNGLNKNYLIRLNTNGTVDASFSIGTSANAPVKDLLVQSDGKIVIGGFFTQFNGTVKNYIARLNATGSVEAAFNNGSGPDNIVNKIITQKDGKLIIGGNFMNWEGAPANNFVRLNANGTVDSNLPSGAGFFSNSSSSYVNAIAIQKNGKIVFGGSFDGYSNIYYNNILRINGTPSHYNSILGTVYEDKDHSCSKQSTEMGIPSIIIKGTPGNYFTNTDKVGNYDLEVDSGTVSYTISQYFNPLYAKLYSVLCQNSYTVNLKGASKDSCCFNFADSIKQCALLNISIQNSRMRRCSRGSTFVNYCNYGITTATSVEVKIEYPPYAIPISSVPMWTSKSGSTLTYAIGAVNANACGTISLIDSIVCGIESITGLTQCLKATISPASICTPKSMAWDKSSMKVTGVCKNDSASFVIANAGTGNMTSSHEYRVYVNDTLVYRGTFLLKSGAQLLVRYPAQGNTIRLEADQHPLHPGKSLPRATVEGCGTSGTGTVVKNLVTSAPLDDKDSEVAFACNTIRDSHDPNDKQAIPHGIGPTSQIEPGEEIEYTIRFQNTGTDTAYVVKIVDTLDVSLDPTTFIEGASSHPYTMSVTGKGYAIVTFTFSNINLPDSTTNQRESNGLISFRITVPSNTPIGTEIKNKAYIYFDYNSPVITNETSLTIGNSIVEDLSRGSKVYEELSTTGIYASFVATDIRLYPNPTLGTITLEMPVLQSPMEMRLYSTIGVLQGAIKLENTTKQELHLETYHSGVYYYEFWSNGERKSGGILILKE